MSLPTSRLVWHCPYIVLFYSADKKVNGEDYREYALIRFDGESWDDETRAENELLVTRKDDFEGWEAWKHLNKEGINCFVSFERKGDRITVNTENLGLAIKNTTTIKDGTREIYAAITGDQCAITDIRISG